MTSGSGRAEGLNGRLGRLVVLWLMGGQHTRQRANIGGEQRRFGCHVAAPGSCKGDVLFCVQASSGGLCSLFWEGFFQQPSTYFLCFPMASLEVFVGHPIVWASWQALMFTFASRKATPFSIRSCQCQSFNRRHGNRSKTFQHAQWVDASV